MAVEPGHLGYPLAVAERAGSTRAAEARHISQPAISQQIRQLERAAPAQPLDRSGRPARPTGAGVGHIHYAHRALPDLAAGVRAPGPARTPGARPGPP
ncbi:LysR family transcriptional regulator [Streptomyces sp. x-80]|uniref:LysR family transcriptional regulator n=1 Tax=Streptomyces sp. x-80 TaxID=2789282 RepID=UPI0039817E3B